MHVCGRRECIFRKGGGCIMQVVIEKEREGWAQLSGYLRKEHSSRANCNWELCIRNVSILRT